MTKAVLEAESADAARRTPAAIPPATLAVPASLQASLMARLDRLGPAKEVAQIGAAIGREFSHALLTAVVCKPDAAAYGTLLREPRRVLHASIAETLKSQVAEIAQSQPELLAHHFTQAGMTEAAVEWWSTAGQRSLARSALLEGADARNARDYSFSPPGGGDQRN